MDKTPKFTAKIGEILNNLTPYQANCLQCKLNFEILERDIEFFKRFQVPPPKMCPDCRRQRRLAFVNYTTLFKRDCDAPNHSEKIISSIPEGTEFPVYDFDYYWHGDRNFLNSSIDFDFLKESFFKKFESLFFSSSQPALSRSPTSTNSDYTNYGIYLKNCYYTFGGINSEDVMFSMWPLYTKNSLDMLIPLNTDLSYEGVFTDGCYNCNFAYFSKDCFDCNFIHDCRNCNDCFGCVNLRNKKYCIWNIQYSKEEYLEKIKELNCTNKDNLEKSKSEFEKIIKTLPVRATRNEHSDGYTGNYIIGSKNCFNSYWCLESDNLNYTDFVMKGRDSYDCSISGSSEKLYFTSGIGVNSFNIKYSVFGRDVRNCEYTMNCRNCEYCFGCIGLINLKFCIFNKQYTEEEYWRLVDSIKIKMLEEGEYGEFFPLQISPFPYNASLSNIVYKISKEKALDLGSWWFDDKINLPDGINFIEASKIEPNIKNVTDDILDVAIISGGNKKPFKIVKDELDFYRRKNIAIPSLTPYERIVDRFEYVNNFRFFEDRCFDCGTVILSSYATTDGFKPYCDDCYKKEIY
jgi:hypothetical protein